jgi:phage recombination protein Bet
MNEITTTTPRASALGTMASRFHVDPAKLHNTLKNTVFKGASDDEMLALVVVANEYGLNPLTKEIYAFPAKGGGIVPVVSIDGWLNIINNHPQMDGFSHSYEHGEKGVLVSCTVTIHRKDRSHPIQVTEYLSECKRNTDPWKMEHRMLRHKAIIQAARIAFGFSGIVDEDDAYAQMRDVTPPKAEASKLFQALTPVTAAVDLPTVPAGGADQSAAEFTLDSAPPNRREILASKLVENALQWSDIADMLVVNGILDEPREVLADCSDDEMIAIGANWPSILKLAKEARK